MIRIAKLLPQVESNHRLHKLIRPAAIVDNNTQGINPPMLCALTNWAMRHLIIMVYVSRNPSGLSVTLVASVPSFLCDIPRTQWYRHFLSYLNAVRYCGVLVPISQWALFLSSLWQCRDSDPRSDQTHMLVAPFTSFHCLFYFEVRCGSPAMITSSSPSTSSFHRS